MSNALWSLGCRLPAISTGRLLAVASGSPTTQAIPGHDVYGPLMWPIAIGICVLVVWVIRRIARPTKLSLANTPSRRNNLTPAHILLLLALWMSITIAAAGAMRKLGRSETPESNLAIQTCSHALWLLGSLLMAKHAFPLGLRAGLGLTLRRWLNDTARGVVGYLAVLPVCLGLLALSTLLITTMVPDNPQLRESLLRTHQILLSLKTFSLPWQVLAIFSAVLLAPLAEEIFFRGLLETMLRQYTGRPWVSICLTAAVFALVHAPYWSSMPALFALAVVLGYNYERTGRLYPAILIHALFNAVNIAASLATTPK